MNSSAARDPSEQIVGFPTDDAWLFAGQSNALKRENLLGPDVWHPLALSSGSVIPLGSYTNAANLAHDHRWAPDLARQIGSRRWFGELAALTVLCAIALSFWPGDPGLAQQAATVPDAQVQQELQRLSLRPLSYGARDRPPYRPTASVTALGAVPPRPSIEVLTLLAPGETLLQMLKRSGVAIGDANRIVALMGQKFPTMQLEAGWRSRIYLGARSRPGQPRTFKSAVLRMGLGHSVSIARRGASFVVVSRSIATKAEQVRFRGMVGANLANSMVAVGVPIHIRAEFLEAIKSSKRSTREAPRPGDWFDLVLASERASDGERQIGNLLFVSLERAGVPLAQSVGLAASGQSVSVSESSPHRSTSGFGWPVAGRLTSRFGFRRHPLLGYFRMHSGVDLAARRGTPIFSPASGVVARVGRQGGYGNYIRLHHANSLATAYGHLSGIAISAGDRIRSGQLIGWVGSSGLATGPHLHFEVLQDGKPVDPLTVRAPNL